MSMLTPSCASTSNTFAATARVRAHPAPTIDLAICS